MAVRINCGSSHLFSSSVCLLIVVISFLAHRIVQVMRLSILSRVRMQVLTQTSNELQENPEALVQEEPIGQQQKVQNRWVALTRRMMFSYRRMQNLWATLTLGTHLECHTQGAPRVVDAVPNFQ